MRVFSFTPKDYFGSNMYIAESCGEGVVIDPSVSYSEVSEILFRENIKIKYLLITHAHFDHFLEIEGWIKSTQATVVVGVGDALALADSNLNCYSQFLNVDFGYRGDYTAVADGDLIKFGDSEFSVVEVPGHSAGSVAFYGDEKLFVGDVLFAGGGFGRVDLPGGDYRILVQSIRKLLSFPKDTKVYCGHGAETTIFQLKTNFI